MLSLAAKSPSTHPWPMAKQPVEDNPAKLLGRALMLLRKEKGLTQPQAGEAFGAAPGISAQAWSQYEAGSRPGIHRPEVQRKLVAALGATLEDLQRHLYGLDRSGQDAPPASAKILQFRPQEVLGGLMIRDRVQAGAFLAADDLSQEEPRPYPHPRDGRYPHADQWLSTVVGDSVNLLGIFDGDLVHCVSAVDIGYRPRTGDIVEVERLRFGGQMRELTIKQVEVTPDGPLLWPRSSNDRWRDPVRLTESLDEGEQFEVRIRGLVVGSVRRY
ncbi:LexA family transcriptional regulator [Caulobacter sp. Root1472]|uniref:helix-turn-helix domain-containing protein n=1 Tax=Caulobacter sp. Root1472 TaxID=1736470 RepID=UPI0009E7DA7A